jgi:hypothetical protein
VSEDLAIKAAEAALSARSELYDWAIKAAEAA